MPNSQKNKYMKPWKQILLLLHSPTPPPHWGHSVKLCFQGGGKPRGGGQGGDVGEGTAGPGSPQGCGSGQPQS